MLFKAIRFNMQSGFEFFNKLLTQIYKADVGPFNFVRAAVSWQFTQLMINDIFIRKYFITV